MPVKAPCGSGNEPRSTDTGQTRPLQIFSILIACVSYAVDSDLGLVELSVNCILKASTRTYTIVVVKQFPWNCKQRWRLRIAIDQREANPGLGACFFSKSFR